MKWIDSLDLEHARHIPHERRLPEAIEILAGHLYRKTNPNGTIRYASALIIAERKHLQQQLVPSRYQETERHPDLQNPNLEEAVEFVAAANSTTNLIDKVQYLRYAEAQLRSLWKQQ